MPRVAGASRQVALEPLGAPRPLAVSSAPALAAAGGALGEVSDVAGKFQLEHDLYAAKSVDTAFRTAVFEAGMGDGGFYTLAGENAVRSHEAYGQRLQKLYEDAKTKLGTGKAAEVGGEALDTAYLGERARATQHYRKELATANDETSLARTQLAANELVAFYNDEPLVKRKLEEIAHEALERGQRAGSSEETIAAEIVGLQSKAIFAAITSAKERDPRDALTLFAKWGPRMDAGTRAASADIVFDAARKISAIEISERLLAGGGSQQAQLAQVREIEDDELRDSVRTRVNQKWTDERAGRALAMQELDSAETHLYLSGQKKNLEDMAPGLSGGAQRAISRLVDARSQGIELAPDQGFYKGYLLMTTQERAKLQDGAELMTKVGPALYPRVLKEIGQARRTIEGSSPTQQLTLGTINGRIATFAKSNGLWATNEDDETKWERFQAFDSYVRLELQRYQDPALEDLLGVLQDATQRFTVDPGVFSSEQTRFGFELQSVDLPNVEMSDEHREEARAFLVEQGTAPTEAAIDALFREWVAAGAR